MAMQKLPPRQKMINMLYLVLTAILALNVSSEVLDAFKVVNDGIGNSNSSLQTKNLGMYSDFEAQYRNDPARADAAYHKAQQAHALSKKLNDLLEQYKKQMIEEAGGIDEETGKIKRDDDINIPTRMFVEADGKRGKELKQEIEATRNQLLALLNEADRKDAEQSVSLKTDDVKDGRAWEFAKFNHVPVVAAVTLLSKYQNDLLSAEGHVVDRLYSSVYQDAEKVDKFAAKVISPSSFILQGESYKADVMVAAYSSTTDPEVFIGQFTSAAMRDKNGALEPGFSKTGDMPLLNPVKIDVANGIGKVALSGNSIGNKKYTGVVRVKSNAGDGYKIYPFEGEYQVAPKMAVVSPKMMNVLYIGLDNPIDIGVPGVAQSDVVAAFEGSGTLVKNPDGSFKALVTAPGNAKVKVNARVNGKMMAMGEQQFRIKRIPDPQTTVDGVSFGGGATGTYVAQRGGVVPKSNDFIYGDIQWRVQKYLVTVRKGPDVYKVENIGPAFNQKVKDLMKGLKKGDAVFVEEIWVMGPDNKSRKITPLAYNITTQ